MITNNSARKGLKIAIESRGFDGWGGGLDFISHVASCVDAAIPDSPHTAVILVRKDDFYFKLRNWFFFPLKSLIKSIIRGKVCRPFFWGGFTEAKLRHSFSDLKHVKLAIVPSTAAARLKFLLKEDFDVVLPMTEPLGVDCDIPWAGYIFDFQHKHLPIFFSDKEIAHRNRAFQKMVSEATDIIVNSESVKTDIENFYAGSDTKIHVLPFSPSPKESWMELSSQISSEYGINKPYFLISNQFWIHKDHKTAFRAFREFLETSGSDYLLVCTGATHDFRFPGYFQSCLELLDELGVTGNVRFLGHVAKEVQIQVMRSAIAVIQPTLFEGGPGGGAAYDAFSMGVPLIVSNIKVNLEIEASERVFFFEAGDALSLSSQLTEVANAKMKKLSNEELLRSAWKRKILCGTAFLGAAEASIEHALERTNLSVDAS